MKLTRSMVLPLVLFAAVALTSAAHAASGCPDDPERCAERGSSMRRTIGVSATAASLNSAPSVAPGAAAPAPKLALSKPAAPKKTARPARASAHAPQAAVPTPGMGLLQKLSVGAAGEGTWSAARANDPAAGSSWIL